MKYKLAWTGTSVGKPVACLFEYNKSRSRILRKNPVPSVTVISYILGGGDVFDPDINRYIGISTDSHGIHTVWHRVGNANILLDSSVGLKVIYCRTAAVFFAEQ
jgi:hypothetical protein